MVKPIYLINNLEDYMKTNTLNRKHIQDVLSIYCSFPGVETFHDAQKGTIRAPKK